MSIKNVPSITRLENNFTFNVWGGRWIYRLKKLKPSNKPIGESWEFSDHPDHPTFLRMMNGKTISLPALLKMAPQKILGTTVFKKFGVRSPFLTKFIDAKQDLSLQVHPDNAYAKKHEGDSGKAESWIILESSPKKNEGSIYIGFKKGKNDKKLFHAALRDQLSEKQILSFFNKVRVKPGQTYHLAPGTVHAIGKGVRLFEIQQASNVTYRVWDWNRKPPRPLHIHKALDVLNFKSKTAQSFQEKPRSIKTNGHGNIKEQILISKPSAGFALHRIGLGKKGHEHHHSQKNRFTVFTVLKGQVMAVAMDGAAVISEGHSILIPAFVERAILRSMSDGAVVLKSYVPF